MVQIHGARLQCLRNGFTMLEMAYEFDKRLKNVENDIEIWEMAKILGNGLDTWDTALVFEKRLYYVGNGLRI